MSTEALANETSEEQSTPAAELLNETMDRYRLLVDLSPDGIVVHRGGVLLYANATTARFVGAANPEEMIGKPIVSFVHEDCVKPMLARIAALDDQNPVSSPTEVLLVRLDGTFHPVESVSVRTRWEGQDAFQVIMRDLTESYRVQQELIGALEVAQRASTAKSEFLSRMSHELRTPLNAIVGFSELLALDVDGDQLEVTEQIRRAGKHLLSLIDNVLDVGRLDQKNLSIALAPQDVESVIDACLEMVGHVATARQVSVKRNRAEHPIVVMADEQRLTQVLINLLSNAIKYNRSGGIVTVTSTITEDGNRCRISVRDTGPGIKEEHVSRLYVPFDRLDAASTDVEGAGVGLALVKQLTEVMNGTVGVESDIGTGSTFWIELPIPAPSQPTDSKD